MSRVFSDSDFQSRTFSDSDFHDSVAQPDNSSLLMRGLKAAGGVPQSPSVGFGQNAAEFLGANAGPIAAQVTASPLIAASGPYSPFVAGAAAGIGRMAQTGFQDIGALMGSGAKIKSSDEANNEAAKEAITNAVGAGIFKVGGAVLGAAAKKVGPQLLKLGPNIGLKYGQAAVTDAVEGTGKLANAPTKEEVGQAYSGWQKANNLKSPSTARAEAGQLIFKPGQAEESLNSVYSRLIKNEAVTPQELYEASQAGRFLKDQARFGHENQMANMGNISMAKDAVDAALEKLAPGYTGARTSAFWGKVGDKFSTFFPQTLHGYPDYIRGASGLGAAAMGIGTAAVTGNPIPALAGLVPFAMSPQIAGAALRGVGAISRSGAGPIVAGQTANALAPSLMPQTQPIPF